jgi:hypothetical protein
MRKSWQIGELLLLLALSVPVVFVLAYLLWPVSPRLAIVAEFISFLTIIVAWFKLLDNFVSHA